jgi:hypothetical protein
MAFAVSGIGRKRTTRAIGSSRNSGSIFTSVPNVFQLHARNRQCFSVILKHVGFEKPSPLAM